MTVFGYLRVSTTRQFEDGLSMDVQESQIANYARSNGLTIKQWIRDQGISGSVPLFDRENGRRLLQETQKGDIVICAKLDRMFRSARNALDVLEQLKKQGVSLHCIDLGGDVCNGIGQLVFTILSAVAEQERSRIRERISEAKLKMRQEGRYQGGKVPFGYRLSEQGSLLIDEAQQHYIRIIKEKHRRKWSLRKISGFLKEELQVNLSHNAIRHIVKRGHSGASEVQVVQ
jgi:putative DNA-invertase from lambdoid prophage Rac